MNLLAPIKEMVKIAQKRIKHEPFEKLQDALITILAGAHGLVEINTRLRSDRHAVVVGYSHPGGEKILGEAAKIDSRLYPVTGGFHLVLTAQEEVQRVANVLHDTLKIERVAPGHCTSELGFAVFLDRFKERFDQAGVGATITLP